MTYMDMPAQGSLSAYDPEDEITYEITSYAAHGRIRLTDRHTGAYLYTPDAGYVGNDEFRYVVRDRYGNYSTAATVSVRVHAIPTAVSFADTEGSTCAAAALRLGEAGIMNGIRVGGKEDYFRPDIAVTRAEFIATAMNAAGISPDSNGFTDSAAASYSLRLRRCRQYSGRDAHNACLCVGEGLFCREERRGRQALPAPGRGHFPCRGGCSSLQHHWLRPQHGGQCLRRCRHNPDLVRARPVLAQGVRASVQSEQHCRPCRAYDAWGNRRLA